jgi:hypothetical protein
MAGFSLMGKALILTGVILLLLGLLITYGNKIPWIGKLPGDMVIRRDNFSLYFPFTSCIIISIILTLIFSLLRK